MRKSHRPRIPLDGRPIDGQWLDALAELLTLLIVAYVVYLGVRGCG